MDAIYINKIVNALLEVIQAIDESKDTTLLIKQANSICADFVKSQNELTKIIEQLTSEWKDNKISKQIYDKSLRLLFDIHKENIGFAKGLNYIVNKEL